MTHTQRVQQIISLRLADPTTMINKRKSGLAGQARKALRLWLADYAGGRCVVCREDFTDTDPAVIGHLIPACEIDGNSEDPAGFVPGVVAAMHKTCNAAAGSYPFHKNLDKINCEGVPTEWPTTFKITKGEQGSHKAARSSYGFPF